MLGSTIGIVEDILHNQDKISETPRKQDDVETMSRVKDTLEEVKALTNN